MSSEMAGAADEAICRVFVSSCTILLWWPLALVPHASGCGRWWLCPDLPPDGRCLTRWALRGWHLMAMTARRCGLGPGVGVRVVACAVGACRCSDSGGALAGGRVAVARSHVACATFAEPAV